MKRSPSIDHLKHILLTMQASWKESEDPEALRCSEILRMALESGPELVSDQGTLERVSPPKGLCLEGSVGDWNLIQSLFTCWNDLEWCIPKTFQGLVEHGAVKEAYLIGPFGPLVSKLISVKIACVTADTLVPRHSEEAYEMLQILEGDEIQIGLAVDDWLERKKYHVFPPTFPKVLKASKDHPFVAISVHTGNIEGKIWLNDRDHEIGFKYTDITGLNRTNVEDYYDKVAKDYDKAMRNWGYCLPQILKQVILEKTNMDLAKNPKVLDLGCGDGAIGIALKNIGFNNIIGVDLSSGMLDLAEERNCYVALNKADLLQPLPYQENHFDFAITAGVTTYLEPVCLENWLKVIKPGGTICIVHKISVSPIWEPEHKRLEDLKMWEKVYVSEEPVPYLPSLEIKGTNTAQIFIFKKL